MLEHSGIDNAPAPILKKRSIGAQLMRMVALFLATMAAGALGVLMLLGVAFALLYPNLPDVAALADYRPKLPLRVFTADGRLIGEFGNERRNLLTIEEIPQVMKDAVLAVEDARFFEHSGVDYRSMLRAVLANFVAPKSQGGSTITMQVARNVYLSADKNYMRKIYELMLTFKLEHSLTKEQILMIYMNQIFLGQRSYGFAAAAQEYFGKPLKDVTLAEAAILAGLPKAPSAYNPISNPKRSRSRQLHIIDQMLAKGFITAEQAQAARTEPLRLRQPDTQPSVHGEYVAEMVRQAMVAQYGLAAYTRGLHVTTSVHSADQENAYRSVRRGIMDYEQRQAYRGPEAFMELPSDKTQRDDAIVEALNDKPDNDDLKSAVVLQVSARQVTAVRQDGEPFEIKGEGLRLVQAALSSKAKPPLKIRPGAIIRVVKKGANDWHITQLPEVEAAFVALDPRTGAIKALVGGFDFQKNEFNHVTQAWRQPGSSFKPFIYSAALEKGVSPTTTVNDAPLFFGASGTGGQAWVPKNYDGRFEGPMSIRRALAKSKNMVSIRVLQLVGVQSAQEWITRFGFEAEKHPPYLTMALGAGSVTPMQMAAGYAVFANEGYRVAPTLITRITEQKGKVLFEAPKTAPKESQRAISARNAFLMNSLLQEITRSGTAARAQSALNRPDIYGKTGTTNNSMDAWFVGYQQTLVAAAWVGYDQPKNLGSRETGGGLSLPIWINYMAHALKNVPVAEYSPPAGVIGMNGDWYFEEYSPSHSVQGLGLDDPTSELAPPPPANAGTPVIEEQDRRSILDLFNQ